MRRHHLFEFTELAACPKVLRQLVTGYLEAIVATCRPYLSHSHLLADAMRSTGTSRLVDLCSGEGGPWFNLVRHLEQEVGEPVTVVLTDKFPSREATARAASVRGLEYWGESVDARRVPEQLQGVRTLFNGFHHFRPADAQAILQDAVAKRQPIAIFEMLERTWLALLQVLFAPLSVLVLTPLVRPVTWWRLVLTYLLPVAPLLVLWDSVVSVLRCYRPEELRGMTERIGGAYHWEAGRYWRHCMPVTYLIGYPDPAPPVDRADT
ncbi:MAG: hypothetical protein GXY58_19350 [Planctomycetaceae bacterium]|nr:hypothetical protein [Planctomycetaceae bacterium]